VYKNKSIGIEIAEHFIKLCFIDPKTKCYNIAKYSVEISGYDSLKLESIKPLILDYIKENKIKTKNIFIILNNRKLILRTKSFSNVKDKEIGKIISNNYSEYFPIELDNYIVDYKIIRKYEEITDVLLVANEHRISETIMDLVLSIKLKPTCINIFHNCVTTYLATLDKTEYLIVMSYIDKIYIVHMSCGYIKGLRETVFDGIDNVSKIDGIVRFSGYKFNKVYLHTDEEWIKLYFEENRIYIVNLGEDLFIKGSILAYKANKNSLIAF
jgi:hypothetical protein